MDKRKKLLELMAGANFRLDVDYSSPERFLESGKRIEAEYAKTEDLGEEHLNRIWRLVCLVLAEQVQPCALSEYGNTSDSSLRQVLADDFFKPDNGKHDWVEAARLAKEALRAQEFTEQQLDMIGQLFENLPDLGISGQLPFEKREGLLNLKELVENGEVGAVYLTEGVSRLSCDQDKIIPYQLLKLLKEHQCRIRTPDGIWNPTVEKDWQELEEEFEDAIDECRVMAKRMFRRKKQKASRGEFVGEPVLAGFIVPVLGQNKERIEAAIIWKVGFKQRVTIHRPFFLGALRG
jgi:hypothetical protein